MPITLYSGTPGSYKSYHAVSDVLSWLRSGDNVIANFPVKYSHYLRKCKGNFTFVQDSELTVEYLFNYAAAHHKPGVLKAQTLVVIDEASIMFNARQFDRKDRMAWIKFFANHRHYNFSFILIAQNDRMLDKQIRGLLEYEVKHRALKHYKIIGFLLNAIFRGFFVAVEVWYPMHYKTRANFHIFSKRKADCYDTMALFSFDDDLKNAKVRSTETVRKKIERIKKGVTDDGCADENKADT